MASFQELRGADVVKMVQDRLGGYANAIDEDVMLDVINEGKDEIWTILKSLNENYFQVSSQFTDNTQPNYFGPLSQTQREYALPIDFRAIRFIEVVTPGYQGVTFVRRKMTSPEWRDARRAANYSVASTNGMSDYLYDIGQAFSGITEENGSHTAKGGFEMVLAQYPAAAIQPVLWYLRALPDFETDTILDQIVLPYSKKIANFAVEKVMRIVQDLDMSEVWLKGWRQDIITIAQSGGQIDQADAQFVQDFGG